MTSVFFGIMISLVAQGTERWRVPASKEISFSTEGQSVPFKKSEAVRQIYQTFYENQGCVFSKETVRVSIIIVRKEGINEKVHMI